MTNSIPGLRSRRNTDSMCLRNSWLSCGREDCGKMEGLTELRLVKTLFSHNNNLHACMLSRPHFSLLVPTVILRGGEEDNSLYRQESQSKFHLPKAAKASVRYQSRVCVRSFVLFLLHCILRRNGVVTGRFGA